jgi:hypothetical protein
MPSTARGLPVGQLAVTTCIQDAAPWQRPALPVVPERTVNELQERSRAACGATLRPTRVGRIGVRHDVRSGARRRPADHYSISLLFQGYVTRRVSRWCAPRGAPGDRHSSVDKSATCTSASFVRRPPGYRRGAGETGHRGGDEPENAGAGAGLGPGDRHGRADCVPRDTEVAARSGTSPEPNRREWSNRSCRSTCMIPVSSPARP